ncbi:MAG: translocation/assembly module TamB domain-containing protein [Candidatus Aminicenantes bacterium]|nr:MAG: translocation/assembly module TamB domain-containing protein [Candidatus Aminicenantes bacterium]
MYLSVIKLKKKFKRLVILSTIFLVLFGVGVVLKNIFLRQIQGMIQENFGYSEFRLSFFPPALILQDARSKSVSPFFSASKIVVGISSRSLLSKDRPLTVLIEDPVLRVYSTQDAKQEDTRKRISFALPFAIDRGVIRNGTLYYWGSETRIQVSGMSAIFTQNGDEFSIKGEAKQNIITLSPDKNPLEGKVSFLLNGRGREIAIQRLKFSGPRGVINAVGSLIDPFDPEIQLQANYVLRVDMIPDILNIPFEYQGWAEGKGRFERMDGRIGVKTEFVSKDFFLNNVRMGRVEGNVDFDGSLGRLDFNVQKRGFQPEYVRVNFDEQRVWGTARGFYLDPIITLVDIPWPVSSPGWGDFSLDRDKLLAEVEFRDEELGMMDSKYSFNGQIRVEWDRQKAVSFFSERLNSQFFSVKLDGGLVIGKTIDLSIDGEIMDLKQAREFVSLLLQKNFGFPEIRGMGQSEIRIFGVFGQPEVHAEFAVAPGGFAHFDAQYVEGQADITDNGFYGQFIVVDSSIEGKIDVTAHQGELSVDAEVEKGLVESLLPGFDIAIPLSGEASGNFQYRVKEDEVRLAGDFSSPNLDFSGQSLTQVKGKLGWDGYAISFPELMFNLHEGKITGSASLQPQRDEFEIDVSGEGVSLASIFGPVQGVLSFEAKGNGSLGTDSALGNFEITDLLIDPFKKTEARGELQVSFSENDVQLELEGNFEPGENMFFISLGIPFQEEIISGDIRGSFTNYDLFLPWSGAEGQINYIAEIRGTKQAPQVKGAIDFQGGVFPFPSFAHALRDYSGYVFFENGEFSVRSIQGKFGGGDVQGSGRLKLGQGGVEEMDIKAEGKNLLLSPLERTKALTDGSITLVKDTDQFVLNGEFLVHRLTWRREITEKFAFSSAPFYEPREEPGFFDDLTLNLRLRAIDNAWMENTLGRVRGRFDLNITGNINSPIVLGDIEALDGDLNFQDRKFRILNGRVSFINPQTIEPYLHFKGETYVKDYRVTFSLDGLVDRLNPEFSSSPPLPPEDVLALLAMGEAFKRTYSYDMSTQLSTASLLSFQLSEEAKKQAEGLFLVDRFRIDPFVIGSSAEVTARLTVGKNISRNFFILYSTNLTTLREEIIRMEWQLTRDLSIVGTRDEEGRIGFDVKIHRRF